MQSFLYILILVFLFAGAVELYYLSRNPVHNAPESIERCPLCGSAARLCGLGDESYVRCYNPRCSLGGPYGEDESSAVKAWNSLHRALLKSADEESAKQREQVSALLVLHEAGMDLMDSCMAEAEAISAHDDAKTGRTLETKTRLENVQACIMAAYGKARKAQERCEALGLKVTP